MVEGEKPENSIMEFLQKTKAQIGDLSKRVANATKSGIETTTEAIQSKVVETKERSKRKKEGKLQSIKSEIRVDGHIDSTPAMVNLSEIAQEKIEIIEAQNHSQIQIVEELSRLVDRVDNIERQLIEIATKVTQMEASESSTYATNQEHQELRFSTIGNELLAYFGATLLTLVGLFGVELYLRGKDLTYFGGIPALNIVWAIAAVMWSSFFFGRVSKLNPNILFPVSLRIQMAFGIGLAVFTVSMFNVSDSQTIMDGWIWISILATTAFLGAMIIATARKLAVSFVKPREVIEVID